MQNCEMRVWSGHRKITERNAVQRSSSQVPDCSDNAPESRFCVAYVTDRGLFLPTLRSAWSALKHSGRPLRVLFVGAGLDDRMWRALDGLQQQFPLSVIEPQDLPAAWLQDATSPKSFITPTALGRMFLPRLTSGRVLYIDGDTLVTGDVSKAAEIDLEGSMIGGVRDFAVMRWRATGKSEPLRRQADILGGGAGLAGYINSGLLLMDSDAIRAGGLQSEMEDMVAAQGYPTVDQDRINIIFKDRITYLDPAWNCSWGRLALQRRDNGDLPTQGFSSRPVVLHFHGPNKPWQAVRMSTLRKGVSSTWRYRREMADFARSFPALVGPE
jgi:lipopolysaccharide biosynthesis glycosyltransferase